MKAVLMIVGFLFLGAALFMFQVEAGTEDKWDEEGARSGAYGSIVLALEGVGFMVAATAVGSRKPTPQPQPQLQPMAPAASPAPMHPGMAPPPPAPARPGPPPR